MPEDDEDIVTEAIERFGLPAKLSDRLDIITALEEQMHLEEVEIGDQFLMRLLCAQLFSIGVVEDSLLIWAAKSCNFDTHCGIDVQFLCGAGLDQTKTFLKNVDSDDARGALEYLAKCDGDFANFSVGKILEQTKHWYGVK